MNRPSETGSGNLRAEAGEARKILPGFDAELGYNGSEVQLGRPPWIAAPGDNAVGLSPLEMRL